jgi:hypothetical protein
MTRQRFCTTAENLYNCDLISQWQKNVQLLFHFATAKFYVGIYLKKHKCYFISQLQKKCTTVDKTNAKQQKKCTTAKQIYCNTNVEALTGYSTWDIIILLLFSLAFKRLHYVLIVNRIHTIF